MLRDLQALSSLTRAEDGEKESRRSWSPPSDAETAKARTEDYDERAGADELLKESCPGTSARILALLKGLRVPVRGTS